LDQLAASSIPASCKTARRVSCPDSTHHMTAPNGYSTVRCETSTDRRLGVIQPQGSKGETAMPRGFVQCAPLNADVNPTGLDQNCYYCTVAALHNMDVRARVSVTETMQQDTANRNEVRALVRGCGIACNGFVRQGPTSYGYAGNNLSNNAAADALALIGGTLRTGQFCGVEYHRPDGSGHMVVATRQPGNLDQILWADFG
jgi:hypothetical protein